MLGWRSFTGVMLAATKHLPGSSSPSSGKAGPSRKQLARAERWFAVAQRQHHNSEQRKEIWELRDNSLITDEIIMFIHRE